MIRPVLLLVALMSPGLLAGEKKAAAASSVQTPSKEATAAEAQAPSKAPTPTRAQARIEGTLRQLASEIEKGTEGQQVGLAAIPPVVESDLTTTVQGLLLEALVAESVLVVPLGGVGDEALRDDKGRLSIKTHPGPTGVDHLRTTSCLRSIPRKIWSSGVLAYVGEARWISRTRCGCWIASLREGRGRLRARGAPVSPGVPTLAARERARKKGAGS